MNWFFTPSPLSVALHDLDEAQRDRLISTKQREYSAAMESMLRARITRLEKEITELMSETDKP